MNKKLLVALVVGVLVLLTIVLLVVYRSQIEDEPVDEPGIVVTDGFSPALEDTMVEKSSFKILLPQGWVDYGSSEEFVAVIGGDEDSYLAGEWAEVRAMGFTKMDQTFDEHLADLFQELQGDIDSSEGAVVIIGEGEATISGQPAYYIQIETEGETEENPIMSNLHLVEGEEDILYLVTIAPSSRWESHENIFKRIVDSFEIK